MKPIRKFKPNRTCTKQYTNYRSYKSYLREDFGKRCAYCQDLDELCGGQRGFHIDHFRPQSLFPKWENNYGNLVYACPYCNIAKSNKWVSDNPNISYINDEGFIDPCDEDFEQHLARYENGRIKPKTKLGRYMFNELKLGLRRHQLAWMEENLEIVIRELSKEVEKLPSSHPLYDHIHKHLTKLTVTYFNYKDLYRETL